ncbi:MAG: hypothetical protein AAGD32_05040 [Planctomycetota bacterium]
MLGKQVYIASWKGIGLSKALRLAAFDHVDFTDGLDSFAHEPKPAKPIKGGTESLFPEDNSLETAVLSELSRAEEKFADGYVGFNYFTSKWDGKDLPKQPDVLARILDRLAKKEKIEKYVIDGVKAIRLKS